MATMKISELVAALDSRMDKYGDIPVVLWDLDSSSYFSLEEKNIEAQRMGNGSIRLSIGPNFYGESHEDEPAKRPLD